MHSTFTWDRGRGWHSGTRSEVRFAAWMPAIWAVVRTLPLESELVVIMLRRCGEVSFTTPKAMAVRWVGGLEETSTMEMEPVGEMWVRAGDELVAFGGAGEEAGLVVKEEAASRCVDFVHGPDRDRSASSSAGESEKDGNLR